MAKKSATPADSGASNGREKALEVTMSDLKKRFGDGAIMKLGEAQSMFVEASSSGCLVI